jgi:Uncharacterised nucleotidyltransferase
MRLDFLESMGIVKTARKEADSITLARVLLRKEPLPSNSEKFVELARLNKVLLRTADQLNVPPSVRDQVKLEATEAWDLFDQMSRAFEERGIPYVVIKSFDSLPDIGHDLDFLISSPSEFRKAKDLLVTDYKVRPQDLTHCDKLVGKFSCYLPKFVHDFEIYPTISQLGEEYLVPEGVLKTRRKENLNGRDVWLTSDVDGVLIRVIHAMFRHNFLKLSDILDFANMTRDCSSQEIIEGIERTGTQDAFLFYLSTIERFLHACEVDLPHVTALKREAENRFGPDRLAFLGRDRLVLPYRIPVPALVMVFLLKAGRDTARGRLGSAMRCLLAPPLVLLNFVNAVSSDRLLKKVW